jgi:hypothetical protein
MSVYTFHENLTLLSPDEVILIGSAYEIFGDTFCIKARGHSDMELRIFADIARRTHYKVVFIGAHDLTPEAQRFIEDLGEGSATFDAQWSTLGQPSLQTH